MTTPTLGVVGVLACLLAPLLGPETGASARDATMRRAEGSSKQGGPGLPVGAAAPTLQAGRVAASATTCQDPTAPDWDDAVRKAAENPRFAVRRAAAGRVAQGGDDAVPAIRRFEASEGSAKIPLLLVDAIAGGDARGPLTEALLESWATDPDFYWRAQALGGLARRGIARLVPLFRKAVEDRSHLYRIEGARGLLAAGDDAADRARVQALVADGDPRARLRVALLLLEKDDRSGAGEIVAAVDGADRTFLDDAWGAREALFALRELRRITDQDWTRALGEDEAAREAARGELRTWARDALPGWRPGESRPRDADVVGGVEVRSCRNGDLFVRWRNDGTFLLGLDPVRTVRIATRDAERLRAGLPALAGVATHGEVVCDYIRLLVPASSDPPSPEVHHKAAPSALPGPVLEWLKTLAAVLDESEAGPQLRDRLGQFAASERNQ